MKYMMLILPELPDPTFGLDSKVTQTCDMTVRDFEIACKESEYKFPCSFEESEILDSMCINVLCEE